MGSIEGLISVHTFANTVVQLIHQAEVLQKQVMIVEAHFGGNFGGVYSDQLPAHVRWLQINCHHVFIRAVS